MKFTKRGVTYVHHCIGSRLSHSQKTLQWPILESNTGFHSGQLPPMTRSHTITMKNGNDSIRRRSSSGHMAPIGLTRERYISRWATRFGKDSNPGRQHRRPETSRLNQQCHPAPSNIVNRYVAGEGGGNKAHVISLW